MDIGKVQTHPLVREGTIHEESSNHERKEKV
jgi:hypothetical protein